LKLASKEAIAGPSGFLFLLSNQGETAGVYEATLKESVERAAKNKLLATGSSYLKLKTG